MREFVRGAVRRKAVPIWHADDIKCYSYEISVGTQIIYYSGDSYEIDLQILQDCISILYQDTTNWVTEHRSHFPLPERCSSFPLEHRSWVVCMHLNCDFEQALRELSFRSTVEYV